MGIVEASCPVGHDDMEEGAKSAVVTGGSRGLGKAIVERLARSGVNVLYTYSKGDYAESQNSVRILPVRSDVRSFDSAREIIERAHNEFGRLDILINNAGIVRDRAFALMTPDDWQSVIDVNLQGTYFYCRAACNIFMRQMRGRIINVTSVAGLHGSAGQANYAASKAGVIGLTRSLAQELGPFLITVNSIAPGYIDTEMLAHLPPEFIKQVKQRTPLRRLGKPEEVAELVNFLASDAAAYITGQVIQIDGGLAI